MSRPKDETKIEAIFEATLKLVQKSGFNGLKMADVAKAAGMATGTLSAISSALLLAVIGVYLAADPDLYRRGFLHLLPARYRPPVHEALQATGEALRRWLMGQLVSMVTLGSGASAPFGPTQKPWIRPGVAAVA